MRVFAAALAAVVVTFVSPTAKAQSLREQMHAYVQRYADAGLFSGVVLVSKGDAVVYEEAFGLAERGFSIPNGTDTKFHIAIALQAYHGSSGVDAGGGT